MTNITSEDGNPRLTNEMFSGEALNVFACVSGALLSGARCSARGGTGRRGGACVCGQSVDAPAEAPAASSTAASALRCREDTVVFLSVGPVSSSPPLLQAYDDCVIGSSTSESLAEQVS